MNTNNSIYRQYYSLGTSQCDLNGLWKLSCLLDAIQDAAIEHNKLLHADRDELSKKNVVWVLFKTYIIVDKYPAVREKIFVETFLKETMYKFIPRYYIIKNETGETIGRVGSLWVLMDITTRKAVLPGDIGVELVFSSDTVIPINILTSIQPVQGERKLFIYHPQYSDIDVNGHVNNTRYIEWLCNYLGIEIMKEREVESVLIDYSYEVPPEAVLKNYLTIEDNFFQLFGTVDDKRLYSLCGKLRERNP